MWLPLVWKQANNSNEKELTELTDCHLLLEKSSCKENKGLYVLTFQGWLLIRPISYGKFREEEQKMEDVEMDVENGAEVFLERWVNRDIQ